MARTETTETTKVKKVDYRQQANDNGGMVYVFGLIGALFYFIQNADSFWQGVVGVLQAIVWPAYVVFKLLESFYS